VSPLSRSLSSFLAWAAIAWPGSACAQLSINTAAPADWKISNGAVSLDWSSTGGNVYSLFLAGHSDNLIDTTNLNGSGLPKGFYMDNVGQGTGATTTGYDLQPGQYLDWWITTASNATNAFTFTQHYVLFPDDPGVHAYVVFNHGPTDVAGALGQVQYVFRISLSQFTTTYSVDSGLNNLGPTATPLPDPSVTGSSDPGRAVQDAAVDIHGLPAPAGYGRSFYTKYDYSSYEYLHRLHGAYGATYGAWALFPASDSMVGGPVKQNLIFTGNILIGEFLSDHLAYNVGYRPPQGKTSSRLFGPIYYRFNTGTPSALFQDAAAALTGLRARYDHEADLLASGYIPSSDRATVSATVTGAGVSTPNAAWTVLSDNRTNFQFSNVGAQYWANNLTDTVSLPAVAPGTYRASTFVLGQWGEQRIDDVAVSSNLPASARGTFIPENFSSAVPVWTIGSPTRSADKFLHGVGANGQDDREYWGNWNYWSDFAANGGAAVYYATAVGSTPATNDLTQLNYIQWHSFNPGLFGGVYNAADDTTDGYKYLVPSFVKAPASAVVPPWQIYFTTTASQQAQGPFAVLSVGLAATNSNLTVSLNGHSLTWGGYSTLKTSDPQVRSGLAGTYQWVVFQFPTSYLTAPGQSNLLTLSVDKSQGVMYDALRLEVAATSALPGVRGWYDYEYVAANTYLPADDTQSNPSAPRTDRLINLSARAKVDPANPLSAGFVLAGPSAKTLVLRGIGPGLGIFGLSPVVDHPQLTVYDNTGAPVMANAGWGGAAALASAFAQVGAFALAANSADAALSATLSPGLYTLRLAAGPGDPGGAALAEIFDATVDPGGTAQKVINLSAIGPVGSGINVLVGGFVITGNAPKKLLIRGIGPGLVKFGVPATVTDPALRIFSSGAVLMAQNDDWSTPVSLAGGQVAATASQLSTAAAAVGAFALSGGSKDAAVLVSLPPGAYSAQVSATAAGTGMVEIYEMPE
jgi:hypothetical protein